MKGRGNSFDEHLMRPTDRLQLAALLAPEPRHRDARLASVPASDGSALFVFERDRGRLVSMEGLGVDGVHRQLQLEANPIGQLTALNGLSLMPTLTVCENGKRILRVNISARALENQISLGVAAFTAGALESERYLQLTLDLSGMITSGEVVVAGMQKGLDLPGTFTERFVANPHSTGFESPIASWLENGFGREFGKAAYFGPLLRLGTARIELRNRQILARYGLLPGGLEFGLLSVSSLIPSAIIALDIPYSPGIFKGKVMGLLAALDKAAAGAGVGGAVQAALGAYGGSLLNDNALSSGIIRDFQSGTITEPSPDNPEDNQGDGGDGGEEGDGGDGGDGGGGCFVAGTTVATNEGLLPIEQVVAGGGGNHVWSFDFARDCTALRKTVEMFRHEAQPTLRLGFDDGVVTCTPRHRFYTGCWTPAGSLRSGDRVQSFDGSWKQVSTVIPGTPQTVFNFHVEHNHNYFVSPMKLLVHNKKDVFETGGDPHGDWA
jgi:Pretoxin HINT domain